jgi:nitrous oxidase accessory protein
LLIILACNTASAANLRLALSDSVTLTVPDGYQSIQEAVNSAQTGDTIYVKNGTYQENTIINKTLNLVGENKEATIIDADTIGPAVRVTQTDSVTISGFTMKNAPKGIGTQPLMAGGIELDAATHCTISGNILLDNGYGIVLWWTGSNSNEIRGNTISNNTDGIELFSSYNNITENVITGNSFYGLAFVGGQNNTAWQNDITSNYIGVVSGHAWYTYVFDSVISNNTYGMWFYDSDCYCQISGNIVSYNKEACHLEYGTSTVIWHNYFVYNYLELTCRNTDWFNSTGVWDNGSEGNFWTSYHGTDTNGDGIGDTAYIISEGNIDHYPLMNCPVPLPGPGDINGDGNVSLADLVLLASAYGSQPGDVDWNPRADMANPWNVITPSDLVILANHYGQHYP